MNITICCDWVGAPFERGARFLNGRTGAFALPSSFNLALSAGQKEDVYDDMVRMEYT